MYKDVTVVKYQGGRVVCEVVAVKIPPEFIRAINESKTLLQLDEPYWPNCNYLQVCLDSNPGLANNSLIDVFSQSTTAFDTRYENDSVSFVRAPMGFSEICREIVSRYGLSYARFYRLTLKHGIMIMATDPRMKELWRLFQQVSHKAWADGNESMLYALKEPKLYYNYQQQEHVHVKASDFCWVDGLLNMLGRLCGLYIGQLAPMVIYHSINTLPDCDFKDDRKESINAEIQHFWKAMAIRQESINSIAKELAEH